ncbi:hypothetical protein [Piscinibacter sp.]|uniref:hypothetical protein n=1 Tax=Piscinibacter sp. TaxID=1903157 RepID=UPI0039E3D848
MIRTAVCLITLAAALGAAHAAPNEKLRIGAFGSGKASGPLLTKNELRECLAIETRVVEGNDSATREREQLEKEKAELVRSGDALKADLETLDRSNAEAIEALIAREKARNAAVESFQARTDAFNARVGEINADRAAFRQRCDNRRFDQGDLEALRKGR